ncbi:LacI family DNA-binding transcriptional regulator [Acinetobacter nectaris]|uniref:LacI family DNA-binding transcriptional regulator n=1 Tax=Acinetobacter nectaris TaxID=1219382 RepID=UPI001F26E62A|nr:substrate-binding domain-containing protein [Acinetobacter nectaris]MCF9034766.1 substrate-binding domain-containing protein [Acinetobacter nectaris]
MADLLSVAKLAGVSRATAARAFSTPELVKIETREKIFKAATELDFRPNYIARQLRTQTTKIIGVMLPTLTNPIFSEQFEAMEKMARENGYALMVATTEYSVKAELEVLEDMLRQRVDGLVLTVADAKDSECLRILENESIPTVLTHNPIHENNPITSISVDNYAGMYKATEKLIEYGHQNIAMITGPFLQSDRSVLRYQGYVDAMRKANLNALPVIELPHHTQVEPHALVPCLMQHDNPISAFLCSNDLLALNTIGSLQRLGYHVPQQVSVVGFDGIGLGNIVYPSLSSVVQPCKALGEVAIQTLLKIIAEETVSSQILPTHFHLGESIASPSPTHSI